MKKGLAWGAAAIFAVAGLGAVSMGDKQKEPEQSVKSQSETNTQKPAENKAPTTVQGESIESTPTPTPAPTPQPTPPKEETKPDCDPNYTPCIPNVSYDLDCGDISISVRVIGTDRHRFDRDGDGYGCESN